MLRRDGQRAVDVNVEEGIRVDGRAEVWQSDFLLRDSMDAVVYRLRC